MTGRKEVARLQEQGIDARRHERMHVVCSLDGDVITVYRNHDLRGLRPRGRTIHRVGDATTTDVISLNGAANDEDY